MTHRETITGWGPIALANVLAWVPDHLAALAGVAMGLFGCYVQYEMLMLRRREVAAREKEGAKA
jgi:hypothetical protein